MAKKLIVAITLLTMLTGTAVGCAKDNNSQTSVKVDQTSEELKEQDLKINEFGWEVPKETLVLKVFNAEGYYAPSEQEKAGVENTIKYYKDKFNIDLKIETTAGDGTEALNLALASNQYADVVYGISNDMTKKFVQQGRSQELTPYMDTIGKDIKKSMGDMYPLFLDDDEKLWYVPRYMGALYELPDYSAHIRYDEYNAIGAPKIETPEDYYNVINEILKANPVTPNGETRYAMSFYDQGDPTTFSGFWGLKRGYKIEEDNTFTYWAFTEEGKEMTKFFNRFYLDGTMDPDAFINKFDDWKSKFSNERIVGAVGGWWISYNAGHEIWNAIDPNTPEDKRYIQVSFKDPEAEAAYLSGKSEYGNNNTIITDKAKDIEGILNYINFQATERGRALTNWGIPNGTPIGNTGEMFQTWNIDEEGNWAVDPNAKQSLINETFSYQNEGYVQGVPILFNNVSRWDDGVHCIWPNQMWYEENKWKSIMFENMKGTIYNASPMILRDKEEDILLIEQAINDAWKMNWSQAVQAKNDSEFEAAWKNLQQALTAAGIDRYEEVLSANYAKNIEKMK